MEHYSPLPCFNNMLRKRFYIFAAAALLLGAPVWAQRGPSKVEAGTATRGTLAPQSEFRGTVYFEEVSDIASEVQGKVLEVLFDEGESVRAGDALVVLDDTLLRKEAAGVEATRGQYRTELRDAEVRFDRAEQLLKKGIATPEQVDDLRFRVESLRHQLAAVEAQFDRLTTLMSKHTIPAPFDGVVLERTTERGEWINEGGGIGTIARSDGYEVLASVPEHYLPYIEIGAGTSVSAGKQSLSGIVESILPRGDIATRSFSVKVRVNPESPLLEAMSAIVSLPTGPKVGCILIPRDAILQLIGNKAVYSISGDQAVRHTVRVLGYQGDLAGIETNGIAEGDRVVVRGQERLRDGSEVLVTNRSAGSAATE